MCQSTTARLGPAPQLSQQLKDTGAYLLVHFNPLLSTLAIAPGLWRHPVCKVDSFSGEHGWSHPPSSARSCLCPLPGCRCFISEPGGCFKIIWDENLTPLKSLAKLPLTSEEPGFHPKTLCRLLVNGKHTSGFSRVIIVGSDLCSGKH